MKAKSSVALTVVVAAVLVGVSLFMARSTHSQDRLTRTWVIIKDARRFEGRWTPDEASVPPIIAASKAYLQDLLGPPAKIPRDEAAIVKILGRWDGYICQVVPYQKEGKRLLHLNFFPEGYRKDDVIDWTKDFVDVEDGGAAYWQAEYDVEAGRFVAFSVNGVA